MIVHSSSTVSSAADVGPAADHHDEIAEARDLVAADLDFGCDILDRQRGRGFRLAAVVVLDGHADVDRVGRGRGRIVVEELALEDAAGRTRRHGEALRDPGAPIDGDLEAVVTTRVVISRRKRAVPPSFISVCSGVTVIVGATLSTCSVAVV